MLPCPFHPRVPPNYLQKVGRHTHTHTHKNIAAKWWRRLQQLPLGSAQSGDTAMAQRRTSPVLHKLRDSNHNTYFFFFASIQPPLIWCAANQSAGQSPFSWHDLHRPPIILENLLLHAHNVSRKENATILSHKGGS